MLWAMAVLCFGGDPYCSCFIPDDDGYVYETPCFYDPDLDDLDDADTA